MNVGRMVEFPVPGTIYGGRTNQVKSPLLQAQVVVHKVSGCKTDSGMRCTGCVAWWSNEVFQDLCSKTIHSAEVSERKIMDCAMRSLLYDTWTLYADAIAPWTEL